MLSRRPNRFPALGKIDAAGLVVIAKVERDPAGRGAMIGLEANRIFAGFLLPAILGLDIAQYNRLLRLGKQRVGLASNYLAAARKIQSPVEVEFQVREEVRRRRGLDGEFTPRIRT
jgi:hypothetical protein